MGCECVNHYSMLRRFYVFSNVKQDGPGASKAFFWDRYCLLNWRGRNGEHGKETAEITLRVGRHPSRTSRFWASKRRRVPLPGVQHYMLPVCGILWVQWQAHCLSPPLYSTKWLCSGETHSKAHSFERWLSRCRDIIE